MAADSSTPITVAMDGQVRVTLAHACLQALAEAGAVDLLHVKGPALDESLRRADRLSSDADVLVRPQHVPAFTRALHAAGWRLVTGFRNGSVFEHAANFHHQDWGYADVHRSFPGVTRHPPEAFAELWAGRGTTQLAHRPCAVPAVLDQALLLCLHAARGGGDERSRVDLDLAWHQAGDERRDAIRERAAQVGAQVALAAAIGELDLHDDRSVPLWRYFAEGGTRLDEWQARLRAAPTWRARASIAVRGVGVNREYAAMALGHEPSRSELAGLAVERVRTGAALLTARVRRRRTDESDDPR